MTPSAPPPQTPSQPPGNIGEWLTLVFTSLLLAIVAVWTQLRARMKRRTQELAAVKPEDSPDNPPSENEEIAALQSAMKGLQESFDELDARHDYTRRMAERLTQEMNDWKRTNEGD